MIVIIGMKEGRVLYFFVLILFAIYRLTLSVSPYHLRFFVWDFFSTAVLKRGG